MLVLLDHGHCGLINGQYEPRSGGRFVHYNDFTFYEGEFNRFIVTGIIAELTRLGIRYVNIAPEARDVTLQTRVIRANAYSNEKCFLLSVHANAGGGRGFEVWTSINPTNSDKIATIMGQEFQAKFPNRRLRTDFSDGDLDKESNFYILKNTRMPAILTENFFMDNEGEVRNILMDRQGRWDIIDMHVNMILRVQGQQANLL